MTWSLRSYLVFATRSGVSSFLFLDIDLFHLPLSTNELEKKPGSKMMIPTANRMIYKRRSSYVTMAAIMVVVVVVVVSS